ncbi:MAG TPA: hypothetical protein VH413_16345 [Verrucomicrobiae bacterium]|jgi:hypothetical protein|nr:hypothetical protein [Verrucomicrobiae bacterium]
MARKKSPIPSYVKPLPVPAGAAFQLCSAWEGERVVDGPYSFSAAESQLSHSQEAPRRPREQFQKSREYFRDQFFIRGIILLRMAFFHFGFRIASEDGKASKQITTWEQNNRRMYRRYAREAWLEWLIEDNVVGVWRVQGGKPPIAYPVENCKLADLWGEEVLEIEHRITPEMANAMQGFSQAEKTKFLQNPNHLLITHKDNVFGFDVLRRAKMGTGFGSPTIASAFSAAAEMTSLEVGTQTLGGACRLVLEQHKMGYEIKSGLHAGSKANHWNEKRSDSFKKEIKGKVGHVRASTNFDHTMVQAANWPDPKHFQEGRFSGAMLRLANWAMPLGQMLLGKNLNPFVFPMLKQQALMERDYMAEHLRTIFIEGLGAPRNIKIVWSNKCFSDPRVAADMLKTALASGPLSQTTFLEDIGEDPETERENKKAEAALPKSHTNPIYDAAHGPPKKGKGRPSGSSDGDDV